MAAPKDHPSTTFSQYQNGNSYAYPCLFVFIAY